MLTIDVVSCIVKLLYKFGESKVKALSKNNMSKPTIV